MGRNRDRTRRQFGALAGVFVAGLAGCLGDSDDTGDTGDDQSDDTGTDTPEDEAQAVVEEFYGLAGMVESRDDLDDYIDRIADLTHSASPLAEFYRSLAESDEGEIRVTVYESVETTVVDEDLGGEAIEEAFFLSDEISDEELEGIAGENLVVEAELGGGSSAFDDTQDGEREGTERWLVAPEDGDWLIVF
ncbi:MAG: hypothetical protein V5A55_10295 [Halovenus sp.]